MANGQSQIQGVPPGVTLEPVPVPQNQPVGVPAGVTLEPVQSATQQTPTQTARQWVPKDDESVAEIQTSDGNRHIIHGDDLAEARRRDPSLKVLSQPQTYRDYARGRTLENMTRAMSGQPMARPEDQAEAEKGKRAGTIAGGLAIATGALGGLLAPGVQVAQETSSILGPEGQPIVKQVVKDTPSIIGEIVNTLPKKATVEQALKVANVAYKLGIGAGGAALLWHELFGTKDSSSGNK